MSYVAKRKQTQEAVRKRANKLMRKETHNAVARIFQRTAPTAEAVQSPVPPMADLTTIAGSPAALAAIQAALGANPGAHTDQ